MFQISHLLQKASESLHQVLLVICTAKLAFHFFQMKQSLQSLSLPCMSQEHLCLFTMVPTRRQQPIMHL